MRTQQKIPAVDFLLNNNNNNIRNGITYIFVNPYYTLLRMSYKEDVKYVWKEHTFSYY